MQTTDYVPGTILFLNQRRLLMDSEQKTDLAFVALVTAILLIVWAAT